MNDRVFVDTNILIYARDDRFPEKQSAAVAWLETISRRETMAVNPQVIGEFCNAAGRRKLMPDDELRQTVLLLEPWSVGDIDLALIQAAWDLRVSTRYQWWDCMILAAAISAGCRYLLSEDMHHDRKVDSITILDPFKVSPAAILTTR